MNSTGVDRAPRGRVRARAVAHVRRTGLAVGRGDGRPNGELCEVAAATILAGPMQHRFTVSCGLFAVSLLVAVGCDPGDGLGEARIGEAVAFERGADDVASEVALAPVDGDAADEVEFVELDLDLIDRPLTPEEITTAEQDLINRINTARKTARTCGTTSYGAAAALTHAAKISTAALNHSKDMANKNFFSHTGSNGSTVGKRVTAAGFSWSYVAENIAAGYTKPADVVAGWLASPGHCVNIMTKKATRIGVGYAYNANSTYKHYWTMDVAKPL